MIPADQATDIILGLVDPLHPQRDREWVEFSAACGRILAEPLLGTVDVPAWDNSAMDGYAVRFEDLSPGVSPTELTVVMEIPAGVAPTGPIAPGQAARIFTGAMLPPSADTIVIQEQTQRQDDCVKILKTPERGSFVRSQGEYYRAGQPLLAPGLRLQAPELALLATIQATQVCVYRHPQVALLSTGNELVAPDAVLKPGQIVDSNRYILTALVEQTGAIAHCLQPVGDRLEDLKASIEGAIADSDLVISTGGVSVGDYDYVDQALAELGGTLHIRAVAIKPGKPLTVATFEREGRRILYFGLPGNPVSAPVSFWRFVQPALRKLMGLAQDWGPSFVQARSRQSLTPDPHRETYLWGRLTLVKGVFEFQPATGSYSSGNLVNLTQTNGLARLRCDCPGIEAGDWVDVLLL
jgi:molybdopterin molybdotransferase